VTRPVRGGATSARRRVESGHLNNRPISSVPPLLSRGRELVHVDIHAEPARRPATGTC
jgi:hypothetical protein